ncbi:hypothetical protein ACQPYK_04145 [Streptosporangium sp. CA-135522]|uniref:hypothetical protein n=1 Tax=Streptosporangium sp. CA-135522 TaxID=3240072 RepID=UPI003D89CE5B
MSDDDSDDGGAVLPFPRVVLPGSFDAPDRPGPRPDFEADPVGGEPSPSGALPRLPAVSPMGPPLHLTVPGTPEPEPEPEPGDEEGAFTLPLLQDPDNPNGRDTVQLAMALMTALGVAAAQGMWHRARHRQALADQARAHADRAQAKAGGTGHRSGGPSSGHGGGRGGSKGGGGLLTGSRHEGGGSRRRGGGSGHPGGGSHRTKDPKRPKGPKSPYGGDAHKRGGKDGYKAPRSTRGGRRAHDRAGYGPKRRKRGKATSGGLGDAPCVQTRKRRPSGKDSKDRTNDRKRKNGKNTNAAGKQIRQPRRTLRWKAPRASKPGPGGDKALTPGRKRWTRTPPGTSKSSTRRPGAGKRGFTRGKGKQSAKRSRKSRFGTWSWRSTPGWVKRWRTRRKATASSSTGSPGATDARGARGRESWTRTEPPPWSEWMRPPPWADRTVRVTVERVDDRPWPRPEASAITVGQAALTAGPAVPPAARSASSSASAADQQGAPIVSMPVRTTQYADADLTIYDVIEADADMAEEITDGVADARATADGCEQLMTRLEALYAEISDLKVPGVLLGMMALIMDKTQTVKARAEAIAANLPAAAEAVSVAGTNAAARHKGLADAVRDAGHTRPAERQYHDE